MRPFEDIGREIGRLVDEKNAAYGDSFGRAGEILEILYPDGVRPAQYRDFLAVTRIIDKLFRIATDRDALGGGSVPGHRRIRDPGCGHAAESR